MVREAEAAVAEIEVADPDPVEAALKPVRIKAASPRTGEASQAEVAGVRQEAPGTHRTRQRAVATAIINMEQILGFVWLP